MHRRKLSSEIASRRDCPAVIDRDGQAKAQHVAMAVDPLATCLVPATPAKVLASENVSGGFGVWQGRCRRRGRCWRPQRSSWRARVARLTLAQEIAACDRHLGVQGLRTCRDQGLTIDEVGNRLADHDRGRRATSCPEIQTQEAI